MSEAAAWLAEGPAVVVAAEPLLTKPYPREVCFADGLPNPYAVRAENRRRELTFYTSVFRLTQDHDVAARETCERYGHAARAGRCDRCGRGVRSADR